MRARVLADCPLAAAPRQASRPSSAPARRLTVASAAGKRKSFNFSAGPAVLPLDVLEIAQAEVLDWHGSGMSVLEMSHRGPEFESIIAKAEKDLRTLMKVPDNYKARPERGRLRAPPHSRLSHLPQVLFVQGGASTQFAALPLNFAAEGATVDFVVTGSWGAKCAARRQPAPARRSAAGSQGGGGGGQVQHREHRRHREGWKVHWCVAGGGRHVCCCSLPPFRTVRRAHPDIPAQSTWKLTPGAAYTHICANETIQGVEFKASARHAARRRPSSASASHSRARAFSFRRPTRWSRAS